MHTPTAENPSTIPSWRPLTAPIMAFSVLGMLVLWLFWDFFSRQVQWALAEQADWGHTLVIPFIAMYFIWLQREKLQQFSFRTTWVGFVPMIIGVGWYSLCVFGPTMLAHHNLRALGVALTIFGIVLLFCGFRSLTLLAFPLCYLFLFGQTISDRFLTIVTYRLQDITAQGAYWTLVLLGMDTEIQGNTITLFKDGTPTAINIAEACSGMRMLMAFLALGVFMAYTGLARPWQRMVLVLMGVPTAIFVNILRVLTLTLLLLVDAGLAAGDFHSFIGLLWLLPAYLSFLGVQWIIRNLVREEETPSTGG